LTAAHCLSTRLPADIGLLVGKHEITKCNICKKNKKLTREIQGDHDISTGDETDYAALYGVFDIIIHSEYTEAPIENDIALVKTSSQIVYNVGVGPTCLPWKYVFFYIPEGPSIRIKNNDLLFCLFWYTQQQNPYNL
jgi:hypothetical protein